MSFDYKKINNTVVVYITGRMVIENSTEVSNELRKLVLSESDSHFIFNLRFLDYISSSGYGIFIDMMRILGRRNCRLVLCEMNELITKIFRIVELTEVFSIFDTEDEAIGFLQNN